MYAERRLRERRIKKPCDDLNICGIIICFDWVRRTAPICRKMKECEIMINKGFIG